eukprot:TRINITY_DN2649_c0_g2_i1.p1 TRINITY_DN2649_c0_g2~~TRINITY_DN2649_c0_g2_i1.p1  ORF type:complete len:862 (-),score=131.06 TRINITY_DN2649_c0_g2_i1:191-2776(-)
MSRRNGAPRKGNSPRAVYNLDQTEGIDSPLHPLPPEGTPGRKKSAKSKKVRLASANGHNPNGIPLDSESGSSPMSTPTRPTSSSVMYRGNGKAGHSASTGKKKRGRPATARAFSDNQSEVDLHFDKAISERDRLIEDLKNRLQQEVEVNDRYAKKLEQVRSKLVRAAELERMAERWASKKKFLMEQITELEQENARLDEENTKLEAVSKRAIARGGNTSGGPGDGNGTERPSPRATDDRSEALSRQISDLESDLAAARRTIDQLEDRLDEERGLRRKAEDSLYTTEQKLLAAERANDRIKGAGGEGQDSELQEALEKSERSEKDMRERNRKLESTIADLRSQLQAREKKDTEIQNQLSRSTAQVEQLKTSNDNLKENLRETQAELESARANVSRIATLPSPSREETDQFYQSIRRRSIRDPSSKITVPLVSPPQSPPRNREPVSSGRGSSDDPDDPAPVHRSFRQSRQGNTDPDSSKLASLPSSVASSGERDRDRVSMDNGEVKQLRQHIATLEKKLTAAKVFTKMHAGCKRTGAVRDTPNSQGSNDRDSPVNGSALATGRFDTTSVEKVNEQWSAKYKRMRNRWHEAQDHAADLQVMLSKATLDKELAEEKFASLSAQHSGILADLKRAQAELRKERERFRHDVLSAVRDSVPRKGGNAKSKGVAPGKVGALNAKLVESYEREILSLREEVKKLNDDLDFKDQLIDELDAVIIKLKTHNEDLRSRLANRNAQPPPSPELMPDIIMGIDTKSLNTSHPTVVPLSANALGQTSSRIQSSHNDDVSGVKGDRTPVRSTLSGPSAVHHHQDAKSKGIAENGPRPNSLSGTSAAQSANLSRRSSENERVKGNAKRLLNDSMWAPT